MPLTFVAPTDEVEFHTILRELNGKSQEVAQQWENPNELHEFSMGLYYHMIYEYLGYQVVAKHSSVTPECAHYGDEVLVLYDPLTKSFGYIHIPVSDYYMAPTTHTTIRRRDIALLALVEWGSAQEIYDIIVKYVGPDQTWRIPLHERLHTITDGRMQRMSEETQHKLRELAIDESMQTFLAQVRKLLLNK